MNREEIEKVANAKYEDNTFAYKGFIEGAEWRINSVWHDVNERPVPNKLILAYSTDFDEYFIGDLRDFEEFVEHWKITLWAYIDDLLPERKEETK